jgi:hypothetical protein
VFDGAVYLVPALKLGHHGQAAPPDHFHRRPPRLLR